jgi:hypothetical protein
MSKISKMSKNVENVKKCKRCQQTSTNVLLVVEFVLQGVGHDGEGGSAGVDFMNQFQPKVTN